MSVVMKAELLRRLEIGRVAVDAFLGGLTEAQMLMPNVVGIWSVRDILAHFIAHEQRSLEELRYALRGERLVIDHGALDAFNSGAVMAWRGASPSEVRLAWDASFQQVVIEVAALAEADFDPAGPVVAALGDAIDGALANNTYAHYAEHLPEMQAWRQAFGEDI